MSINNLIAQAHEKAQEVSQPVTIEQAQSNPLAGFTAEQIQALAAIAQQQPVAQEAHVVQAPIVQAPVVQAPVVMPAMSEEDKALAAFMTINAPSIVNTEESSFVVDAWLKPDYSAMLVNDIAIKPFAASIVMAENDGITQSMTIRLKVGETTQYIKTYNGITSPHGTPWADEVRQAIALAGIQNLSKPYPSYDIVLTALEDVISLSDGSVVVPAGTTLGHASAATGKNNVLTLIAAARKTGKAHTVMVDGKAELAGDSTCIK